MFDRFTIAVAATLVTLTATASTPIQDIDKALRQKNWAGIEHGSLLLAQAIYPNASEVLEMVNAGMADEAIASTRKAQPWQRVPFLLAAASGNALPMPRKLKIVHAAFEVAQSDEIRTPAKVDGLADVALAYARLGANDEAHQAFNAALSNAKSGMREGAYGSLANTVVLQVGAPDTPLWMLDEIASGTKDLPPGEAVMLHRSLAAGYFNLHQVGKAIGQLELALSSAQALSERREKRVAVQSLARLALDHDEMEFARQSGDLNELAGEMAAFYARKNDRARALNEIAKLGPGNLYTSPRQAAVLRIINDALKQGAIDRAVSYCTELCSVLVLEEIRVRTRIGQRQVEAGQRDGARANLLRAKELVRLGDPYIGDRDVLATLDLARAAKASGMQDLAKETVAAAVRQTGYVSLARRGAERPLSEARTSQVLSEFGNRDQAVEMLVRAWSEAKELAESPLGEQPQKAAALVEIAKAARALKPGRYRLESQALASQSAR